MLHIHNGSSNANTLKEYGFAGEHFAFQEVLIEGPTPDGLSPDEWLAVRSEFLAQEYSLQPETCRNDLQRQEVVLASFKDHTETVLWFEHDMFCQINLIYLLDWFSKRPTKDARLSLICIGEFPGKPEFRGLGELTGEELASLFEDRHQISDAEFDIAIKAWAAYRSNNPEEISRLMDTDTSAMPFLRDALRLHLTRFPSTKNGLNRIENKALEIIANGAGSFKSLFPRFIKACPTYGLGDSQFWSALKRLATAKAPLLALTGTSESGEGESASSDLNNFIDASFELTKLGRSVLAAEQDFIEINGIDLWLGGVHLVEGAIWRWDEQKGLLRNSGV